MGWCNMNLPFKMRTETDIEKYRHDSFWEKEPETLRWIESFGPHDTFFDVGANVGVYSLYAASLFPKMVIYAFEPMPGNYNTLDMNVMMNRFHITVFHCAVGARGNRSVTLEVNDFSPGSSGAQMKHKTCGGIIVDLVSIDGIANSEKTTPDHVKIDIDGQELEVVKGMKRTLPDIKSILIEVSTVSKGPVMDILTAAGFTTDNRFNSMTPHSRERRAKEGIDAENIVFTR